MKKNKKHYYFCPKCFELLEREQKVFCISDKIYKNVSYCKKTQKKVKLKRISKKKYEKLLKERNE